MNETTLVVDDCTEDCVFNYEADDNLLFYVCAAESIQKRELMKEMLFNI